MTDDVKALVERDKIPEKRAPVQGFSAGIPWDMHLRAYDAYCKMYRAQPALIDLEGRNCRGGFGTRELDMFIPGWRVELDERTALRARIETLSATLTAQAEEIERLRARLEITDEITERYDGIACRDETIRLLEQKIAALKAAQEVKAIESGEHLKEGR